MRALLKRQFDALPPGENREQLARLILADPSTLGLSAMLIFGPWIMTGGKVSFGAATWLVAVRVGSERSLFAPDEVPILAAEAQDSLREEIRRVGRRVEGIVAAALARIAEDQALVAAYREQMAKIERLLTRAAPLS